MLFSAELVRRSKTYDNDDDEGKPQNPEEIEDLFISVTCHPNVINGILAVTGHRPFNFKNGGILPIIVKASSRDVK